MWVVRRQRELFDNHLFFRIHLVIRDRERSASLIQRPKHSENRAQPRIFDSKLPTNYKFGATLRKRLD